MADKMRVHILAKDLNVSSKAILDKCHAEGLLTVKNHMSTLTHGQEETIREWFSEGPHKMTVEVSDRVNLDRVRIPRRKPKAVIAAPAEALAVAVAEAPPGAEAIREVVGALDMAAVEAPLAEPPLVTTTAAEVPVATVEPGPVLVEGRAAGAEPASLAGEAGAATAGGGISAEAPGPAAPAPGPKPVGEPAPTTEPIKPVGPQNIPKPARLRGPRIVRYEAPDLTIPAPPRGRVRRISEGPEAPGAAPAPAEPGVGRGRGRRVVESKPGARSRPTTTPGRRSGRRSDETVEQMREWRDRDLIERRERLEGATGRRIHTRRLEMRKTTAVPALPTQRTQAHVQEPIKMKGFCAAIGIPFLQVFNILKREYDRLCTINSVLDKDTAEVIAAEFGVELKVVEARTSLDLVKEEHATRQRNNPSPRCPVVTVLGHVDHGKTSLLDAIRRTHVAAMEDGGITQHIGAYHVETPAGALTFIDTPGHQAFTAMRARGANLTDIAVLVVAADDGVMPQTLEAISHVKAAGVPVVVALNKIDLGRDKTVEIYSQLAAHGLTPSGNWGGETDVIPTSALTGEGIGELLEHLVALGQVLDLEADPGVPAWATVIEAETKEGVGPVVRVLVREGALHQGDIVVCGNAAGKVRALHDDKGRSVEVAGPSIPVEIWGLEDVPLAGDTLYQVGSMQQAKAIATEVSQRRTQEGRTESRKARTLEDLFKQRGAKEIPDLNVILKADVDGSVEVLRHALGQIPSEKVRMNIRHAGVGAVNDSDVVLAEASEAVIVAFRVTVQPGARKLVEARQVDVRYYRVVYEVVDDIVKTMEGKLPPMEEREPRATAEVRAVFKITKVGQVAGCMVIDGVVARQHRARVVRDGAVVRDDCEIESLRHFKEDVKEMRAGMECGIRLDGFSDLKPGDRIETYEVVKIARTL